MDHCISGRRRHGLTQSEFGPVFRSVTERLTRLVESREDFPEAEALFRVLWRFNHNRVGPPSYPKEINWQLITDYVYGPLSPIPKRIDVRAGESSL